MTFFHNKGDFCKPEAKRGNNSNVVSMQLYMCFSRIFQ